MANFTGSYLALEGSVFIAGALVQWLRDGLELFADASETQKDGRVCF
ncbi:MAG: hypothetical protein Ct9H300mP28_24400 [Pseudomonadota bacterium]|nr:MAG: hypothetical protein Ct9H300mP28_24400 [Pseudomonadota bacterium]